MQEVFLSVLMNEVMVFYVFYVFHSTYFQRQCDKAADSLALSSKYSCFWLILVSAKMLKMGMSQAEVQHHVR